MQILIALVGISAVGLAAFCIETHLAKVRKIRPFHILLPCLLSALIYFRFYQTPLTIVKGVFLLLTLYYASVQDFQTREVDNSVSIMIAMTALIQFELSQWIYMLLGAVITALPLFAAALMKPGKIGGADIKIMAASGFLLGAEKGILALIVGLLSAVICIPLYRTIKKKPGKAAFALVPFLAVGIYAAFLL